MNKPYSKIFKNFLHNTLKITKDDIRQWTQEAVERTVERKVDVLIKEKFGDWNLQHIIDDAVRDYALGLWGESHTNLNDYIKQQIVKELLHGVKLKVDIAKTKKEATDPNAPDIRGSRKRIKI